MRLLLKLPLPVPSLVLVLSAIVGFWLVLQTTPRAVMLPPPSELMVPPLLAVVDVIADAAVVDASAVTALEITSDGNDATDVLTINNGTNGSVLYRFYIVPATHTDDVQVDGTTYALGTGKSTGLTFIRINNAWRLAGSVEYP